MEIKYSLILVALFGIVAVPCGTLLANPAAVDLGTADNFGVLAGGAITGTGSVEGDLGSASAAIAAAITFTGTKHPTPGDPVVATAMTNGATAYNDGKTRTPDVTLSATAYDLGGSTLTSGVYKIGAACTMTTAVTFDAEGDPDAVFIIQVGTTWGTTAGTGNVILTNGAESANIFWIVEGAVSVGANCNLAGNILGNDALAFGATTTLDGRALAVSGAGAITLATTVTEPLGVTLAQAKTAALNVLTTNLASYVEADYEPVDWTTLNTAKTDGDTAINAATSTPDVTTERDSALTAMAAVPTIAETLAAMLKAGASGAEIRDGVVFVPPVAAATLQSVAEEGSTTSNPIKARIDVVLDAAAAVTLAETDVRGSYRLNNDDDVIDYTLPACEQGMIVTLGNSAFARVITVDVDSATDSIILDGSQLALGNAVDSSGATTDIATFVGVNATNWIIMGARGTWVDGGGD